MAIVGGGVTGVARQRRAEAPRGAGVLPDRQREEGDGSDRVGPLGQRLKRDCVLSGTAVRLKLDGQDAWEDWIGPIGPTDTGHSIPIRRPACKYV